MKQHAHGVVRMMTSARRELGAREWQGLEERVEALKALANDRRLKTFLVLARAGREMAAGEVQRSLGIPATTLSHQLEQLRHARLVTSRREERFIYYAVAPEMVEDLVELLSTYR
jgi:ArsR family transcriptional regulator, arsenate/arsenite/antimonite-responsive transcriptional repressor